MVQLDLDACKASLNSAMPEEIEMAVERLQESSYRFTTVMYDEEKSDG